MIADIAPRGRATLPEKLKVEVFNRLRQETGKTGTRVDSLIWVSGPLPRSRALSTEVQIAHLSGFTRSKRSERSKSGKRAGLAKTARGKPSVAISVAKREISEYIYMYIEYIYIYIYIYVKL